MAKDYVDQHIVPKRYLDRFGIKDGKRYIVGTRIVAKGTPSFFPQSTANVGYIKNYYDVTDKNDPKYWEHYLAEKIDTLCGSTMENFIAKVTLSQENATVLSDQDREALSKVIVAQMMRIPSSFDYVTGTLYPRVSEQVKESVISTLPQFLLEKYSEQIANAEFTEQEQKELILNHAFDPGNFGRYCGILQDGVWMVFFNAHRNCLPFITSDNPVLVERPGSKETGLLRNGLANPATCIFYPLSPAIAVAVFSRNGILGILAEQYDGKKTSLSDLKYIANKNAKIMEQAYQHSFFPQPLFDAINIEKKKRSNSAKNMSVLSENGK